MMQDGEPAVRRRAAPAPSISAINAPKYNQPIVKATSESLFNSIPPSMPQSKMSVDSYLSSRAPQPTESRTFQSSNSLYESPQRSSNTVTATLQQHHTTSSSSSNINSMSPQPSADGLMYSSDPLIAQNPTTSTSTIDHASTSREPVFRYSSLITYALSIPLMILLAFGGKYTLLILAFGSLLSFIFDILGSIEGSLMTAMITILGLWTSLVWAARLILKQSLSNFTILGVMGVILSYTFLHIASAYRAMRIEFDSSFYFIETLMFATLPLLSSVIITWFICIEIPALDIPIVLSTVYFAYVLILCHPRQSSAPVAIVSAREQHERRVKNVLAPSMALMVYAVPVFCSPIVHAAAHHHAIYRSFTTGALHPIADVAISACYPLLLMCIAAEHQISYFSLKPDIFTMGISVLKTVTFCALLFCLQAHPYFEEIKALSKLAEPYATLLYMAVGTLTAIGIALQHSASFNTSLSYASASPRKQSSLVRRVVTSSIAGAVCGLLGVAVRLPKLVSIIAAVGGVLYSEYCQNWSGSGRGWIAWLFGQVLVFTAGLCLSVVGLTLTGTTLYFLDVELTWHGYSISMKQLCAGFTFVLSGVTTVVSLALQAQPATNVQSSNILPTSSGSDLSLPSRTHRPATSSTTEPSPIFSLGYSSLLLVITAFELFVREQSWTEWETYVDIVYPPYLLGTTALVLILLSYRVYSRQLLSKEFLFVCFTMQTFKLLHLIEWKSNAIAACGGMVIAYVLPFIIHASDETVYDKKSNQAVLSNQSAGQNAVSSVVIWTYFVVVTTMTALARVNLIHTVLQAVLDRDVEPIQSTAAAFALISAFTSGLLHSYRPKMALLRTVLLVVAAVCVLIASGSLPITLDASSPTFLVLADHPDLYDNSGLYLLLSAGLILLAAGGVIAIRKPVSRVLFILMITYCGGKTLLGRAFPPTLNIESTHSGVLLVPALYSYVSVFLAAVTSIQAAILKPGNDISIVGLLLCLLPIGALMLTFLLDEAELRSGVIWGAFAINAMTAFLTRCAEMAGSSQASPKIVPSTTAGPATAVNSSVAVVCAMMTASAIIWNWIGSVTTAHVDADLTVPISFLLLLCTRRNIFVAKAHPLALAVMGCTAFWLCSTFHSVFIRNFGLDSKPSDFEPSLGIFKDEDVSIWSSGTKYSWIPLLNIFLALIPLPAIILSFLRRKGDSEEMIFVLAIFSCVSILGAQCWSVRYLGAAGLTYASFRCYEMSTIHKEINRLI